MCDLRGETHAVSDNKRLGLPHTFFSKSHSVKFVALNPVYTFHA